MKWIAPLWVMAAVCVALLPMASCGGVPQRPQSDSIEVVDSLASTDTITATDTALAEVADSSVVAADSLKPLSSHAYHSAAGREQSCEADTDNIFDEVIHGNPNLHHHQGQGKILVFLFLAVFLVFLSGLPLLILLITHLIDKSRRNNAMRRAAHIAHPKSPIVTKWSVGICFIVFLSGIVLALFFDSFSVWLVIWFLYMGYLIFNFLRAIFRKL
ncbi:MAG: hypothetical protein PUE80_10360 [bacterium]|nr:hypothetical protein [bacterium]